MVQIDEIARAWDQEHSRRALGGRRALAGFYFQLNESLLRFFKPVIEGRPPDSAAFDRLSDFATQHGDAIVFVEHKLTLRRSNYLDALGLFLLLDAFLGQKFLDVRHRVRYRIVTSRIEGVNEKNPPRFGDVTKSNAWKQIVDDGRFLGIEVQPDPRCELLKLLWPVVRKPSNLIRRSMQFAFDAGINGFEGLSSLLIDAYETDMSDVVGIQCPWLDPGDLKPNPAPTNRVLTGQRPSPQDWRDGCFMQRSVYVDRIAELLQNILRPPDSPTQTTKVPILWITGGSGVGKSGLLLASLDRVLRDEDIDCAWVHGSTTELCDVLEKMHQKRAIIGIDDLFAPVWRDPAQWDRLAGFVRLRRDALVLIASAPVEYLEAFTQNEATSGIFEHHTVKVEPLNEEEQRAYAEWYVKRTGADARAITVARGDHNFVLASVRYKILARDAVTLEDFAVRLWGRLRVLAVEQPIAAALAAIRIGVSAPATLFGDPKARDGLAKLDEDYLFLVRSEEQPDGSVVKRISTHRALAEQLYTGRFPMNEPHVRAAHLLIFWRQANADARQALMDVVGKKDHPVEDNLAFAFLLALGHSLECARPGAAVFAQLCLWELCARRRELPMTDRRIALDWLCRLVSQAGAIDSEFMGYAYEFCWPFLIVPDGESAQALPKAVQCWLDGHLEAERWNQVWQLLWNLPTGSSGRQALIELARRWLASHRTHIGWTHVFQKLFDGGIRDTWLSSEAYAALEVLPANRVEHHLIRKLATLMQPHEDLGELWIGRLVLQTNEYLNEQARDHLDESGCIPSVHWIELVTNRHADSIGAGRTLQLLLTQLQAQSLTSEQYSQVSRATMAWLMARDDRPEWPHVWQRLTELIPRQHGERESLLRRGLSWLREREDRPEWSYVWRRLTELIPPEHGEHESLLSRGLGWLPGREDRPEWAHIWQGLLAVIPPGHAQRESLLSRGLGWLPEREGRPEWSHVWRRLIELIPPEHGEHKSLLSRGLSWLPEREDRPEWSYVWQRLIAVIPAEHPEREGLLSRGLNWLSEHDDRPGWPYVWQRLIAVLPPKSAARKSLLRRGLSWLRDSEDRPGWPYVWQVLMAQHFAPHVLHLLANAGRRWLTEHPTSPGCSAVRSTLRRLGS